ncbi:MAG: hypothetical protein K2F90_01090, partial [Clostridiales bacterium]|nr:hypothetical protein [Clostridiales bacterium]
TFSEPGNWVLCFLPNKGRLILYGLVGLSFIVSTATENLANLPSWFGYLDILGTYLNFFSGHLSNWFIQFWQLMVPIY